MKFAWGFCRSWRFRCGVLTVHPCRCHDIATHTPRLRPTIQSAWVATSGEVMLLEAKSIEIVVPLVVLVAGAVWYFADAPGPAGTTVRNGGRPSAVFYPRDRKATSSPGPVSTNSDATPSARTLETPLPVAP